LPDVTHLNVVRLVDALGANAPTNTANRESIINSSQLQDTHAPNYGIFKSHGKSSRLVRCTLVSIFDRWSNLFAPCCVVNNAPILVNHRCTAVIAIHCQSLTINWCLKVKCCIVIF
jgi:hypothetical protein